MAGDSFLLIDGVPGESTDKDYKDHIEILSYNHGVTQPTSASTSSEGGGTVARCNHQDFSITKNVDRATSTLLQKCATGEHIKSVTLTLCRAGGTKRVPYMKYEMTEVVVSGVNYGGVTEGLPTETVTFNYGKIKWTYTMQKRADGTGGGNVEGSWNLIENTP